MKFASSEFDAVRRRIRIRERTARMSWRGTEFGKGAEGGDTSLSLAFYVQRRASKTEND